MDSHGLRRACAWIGNNATTAMRHYALLKDRDFIDEGSDGKATPKAPSHDVESGRMAVLASETTNENVGSENSSTPKRNRTSS